MRLWNKERLLYEDNFIRFGCGYVSFECERMSVWMPQQFIVAGSGSYDGISRQVKRLRAGDFNGDRRSGRVWETLLRTG
jgi:hypothetical protein